MSFIDMNIRLTWPKRPDVIPAEGGIFNIGVISDATGRAVMSGENAIAPSFVDVDNGRVSPVTIQIPENTGAARTVRVTCGERCVEIEQSAGTAVMKAVKAVKATPAIKETIPGLSTYGVTGKAGKAGEDGTNYSADTDSMYSVSMLRRALGLKSTSYTSRVDGWAVDVWKYRSGALTSITFDAEPNSTWTTGDVVMARNLSTKEMLILN